MVTSLIYSFAGFALATCTPHCVIVKSVTQTLYRIRDGCWQLELILSKIPRAAMSFKISTSGCLSVRLGSKILAVSLIPPVNFGGRSQNQADYG